MSTFLMIYVMFILMQIKNMNIAKKINFKQINVFYYSYFEYVYFALNRLSIVLC